MRTDLSLVAADFPLPQQIFLYFQPFLRWHWKSRQFNGLGKAIILPTVKPLTPIQFRRLHFHDMFSHKP